MTGHRYGISALLCAVVLAACSSSPTPVSGDVGTSTTTAPATVVTVDLADPEVATALGSPPFEPVAWQRFVGPWTAVGDGNLPVPNEVAIMQAAASDLPPPLLAITPRAIVRTASVDVPADHPATGAVAVSKGPDIYLLDGVFGLDGATRFEVLRAMSHELVHVAQWYALSPAYTGAALDGRLAALELDAGSDLVADWAAATGWTDGDADPLATSWEGDGTSPTPYGATSPAEDMAESVSLAVTGRHADLDDTRRAWIEAWLGTEVAALSAGQPWVPPGSVEVTSPTPLYDRDVVDPLVGNRRHVDQLAFELAPAYDDLDVAAAAISTGLASHRFEGDLAGAGTLRTGTYQRTDGSTLHVELRDLRTDGAAGLLLTYVLIW